MSNINLKQLVGDLVTPESLASHRYSWDEIVRMPQEGLLEIYNLLFAAKDGN